jgi:hypothetical protein
MKAKSPQAPLYYVGIDGTEAVDTFVFGNYWADNFKWTNLLSKLALSGKRYTDADHPSLPILRRGQKVGDKLFADGCIMPEGVDGKGIDPGNWTGADASANQTLLEASIDTVRTSFVMSPHCDTTKKALGLAGDIKADLIYLSSHGLYSGRLLGETTLHSFSSSHYMFDLAVALAAGTPFTAPKWVIIAACSILDESNWNSWRTLMSDPGDPVRGILGYRATSPGAEDAARLNISFINKLASGMTMLEAWRKANEAFGSGTSRNWSAVCNVDAVGDTLTDWNAFKLKPITVSPLVVKGFTHDDSAGSIVAAAVEPYRVRWLNRKPDQPGDDVDAAALKVTEVKPGDVVTIAVAPALATPPAPPGTFAAGSTIDLTLFFIQIRFSKEVEIDAMFTVKDQFNISKVDRKRVNAAGTAGNDTWSVAVAGTPTIVALTLECKRAIPASQSLTQGILWIHGSLISGGSPLEFDFKEKSVTAR